VISSHTRNVSGMHQARRCEAFTREGESCGSPAVKGKKRCHVHGGKGAGPQSRSGAPRRGAYARAVLELDRALNGAIKKIDAQIRRIERGDNLGELVAKLTEVTQDLRRLTQQMQPELGEAPGPGRRAAKAGHGNEREVLSWPDEPVTNIDGGFRLDRSPEAIRDRARGAMLGLAVGSALGTTVKSFPRDSYRHITEMWGGGKLGLKAGQWTGVTAMAMALADSLTIRRGLDETDFIERLLDWQRDGAYSCTQSCVGIGRTTAAALELYRETGDPIAGSMRLDTAGNGSLVRLAPLVVRYCSQPFTMRELAAQQSRVTHGAAEAVDACIAFSAVMGDAMRGLARDKVLQSRRLPDAPLAEHVIRGSWRHKDRDQIASSGYVIHTLEAALWCVGTTTSFEEAVVLAVNLGDCADGVGAATGQLAGALYGARLIPSEWLECLAWRERIVEMTDALVDQSIVSAQQRPRRS
jgi:ADP-ribosyl-[dinitrogen reductase] hydrolase